MSIDHRFYMDTAATRKEVRDVLVGAGIGFEAKPDMPGGDEGLPDLSLAFSPATSVTVYGNLERYSLRPDNGVLATLYVGFRDRKLYLSNPDTPLDFEEETTRGVMALLRAFPDADVYWVAYDAEHPMLLRRSDRRGCGGGLRLLLSMMLETVIAALLAPVVMLTQSIDVVAILSGRDSGWNSQRRDDGPSTPPCCAKRTLWVVTGGQFAIVTLVDRLAG